MTSAYKFTLRVIHKLSPNADDRRLKVEGWVLRILLGRKKQRE